ncbi:MAG: type IV pilus assembly protein PilM [Deltaproteobacteria bacterium]|nr:type IV pilus assembly protein PilM [Deltaproteobacteria bacterium]
MAKNCIGLDIGSSSIKIVQVKEGKKGLTLLNFGIEPIPPQAIVDGAVMNQSAIVDAIRAVVTRLHVRQKDVALAVAGHSIIIKKIPIPPMPADQLDEQISWEADHHVPFDKEDVELDYEVLREDNGQGNMDVLLVAAKKDMVHDYAAVAREAQLNPLVVDIAAFAIQNAFEKSYGFPAGQAIALVNLGASISTLNIVQDGITMFTRDVTIGGNAFTEEIQKQLHVGYEEAEAYKVGSGALGGGDVVPQEVGRVLAQVSDLIAGELQRSIDFFLATTAGAEVERLYLGGGTAQVPQLRQAIERRAHLDVEVLDPFRNVFVDESRFDMPYLRAHSPIATVAFGLALRRPGDNL